jgi:predicted transposase/invertase (TIGR01784 family)
MKTDKIFYTLFQIFPELLFQLIGESPSLAQNYQFKSIEIKELAFRLDGVFLPNESHPNYPIYFVEVQFQKDDDFYWRFITEIFIYLKQYKPDRPCYPVILWAKRSLDRSFPIPYQNLLNLDHIQRIYLDQIPHQPTPPLGISILRFILVSQKKAPQQAQSLISQTRQQIPDAIAQKNVIELIEKIVVYKFPHKSRQELEAMFNLTDWKQTKFYREAEQEGKLKTVPLLLRLGLKPEQIAQELELSLEVVREFIANQNN